MVDPFGLEARYYDKIWGSTRNYEAEAQFLRQLFKDHRVTRVLDLACGTAGHCLELTKLGYSVVGLDVSQTMLEKARKKLSKAGMQVSFVLGDMTEASSFLCQAKITLPFDAVICMGNSLAHMVNSEMLGETLNEVRRVLKRDGVFIFWVKNAEKLKDDRMKHLQMDAIVNEQDLQLALLNHNLRDSEDKDVLI